MAIIKRGILGGFSNKIGSVVGSSWKGIAVMRSLPLSVANPDTAKQRTQRSAFRTVSQFASQILTGWIKPLWDREAHQMSGYNAFIQANIDFVKNAGYLKPIDMIFSRGRLGGTDFTATPNVGETAVEIVWNPTPSGSFQLADDNAYVLLVDVQNGLVGMSSAEAVRSESTVTVDVSGETSGSGVIAVLAFLRADGTISGDSVKKLVE